MSTATTYDKNDENQEGLKEASDGYRDRLSQVETERHAEFQSPLANNYLNVNNNITTHSEYCYNI